MSMDRGFTFFRSYRDAVRDLPAEDRLAFYEAIMSHAFEDSAPSRLTGTVGVLARFACDVMDEHAANTYSVTYKARG